MTPADRWQVDRVLTVGCLVALVVLTALVAAGTTQPFDDAARDFFRPGDQWTTVQVRADHVVELFQPITMLTVLAVAGLAEATRSRSVRPVMFLALVSGTAMAVTLTVKFVVARPDPHGELSAIGGAFPSGHVMAVLLCLGAIAMLLGESVSWRVRSLVLTAGIVMGVALLVTGAHWLTDVLGGAFVASLVLGWASRLSVRRPAEVARSTTATRSPAS